MPTERRPYKVFLCHALNDQQAVSDLYKRLTQDGVDVWLSSEKLLPGQDREHEIRKAVRASDTFVVCLSKRFNQAGIQLREVRLALDTAMEQPEDEIFIIPARLEEDCEIPDDLKKYYPVDLFSENGYDKLYRSLKLDAERKNASIAATRTAPVEEEHQPLVVLENEPIQEEEERPGSRFSLPANLEWLRPYLGVKYFGILIGVLVVLFGVYSQVSGHSIFAPAPTPTSTPTLTLAATATATVVTQTATDTPVPTHTDTPTITLSPVPPTETLTLTPTVIPPVAIGKDWLAGCISTLWMPYPSSVKATDRGDGCWKEPLYVFSAENGDLDFLTQQRNRPAEIYGLFTPLPDRGTVTFKIKLRDLTKVDLWMGVFEQPDVNSPGLLMIVPAGNVKNRNIAQKDPSDYETLASTSVLEQGTGYSVTFRFTENSARGTVNPSVFTTNSVPLTSAQKWLFFGYKGLGGSYRVDGTFFSFELK